jgi:NarL family two-component system sensor histidine kinase LiaS
MQMRAAKNLAESDPAAARQAIDAAETLLKTAQHDLALIIAELRPAALDAQGLPAALTGYLPQWSQNAGIQAELHVQGERALPLEKEQTLFRLVQEALSNVARHSHATRVDLNLDYNSSQVSLQIKDNGQGFDPEAQQRTGYGLQSMEQRARSVGGELTVQSSPGLGTRVQANIPLEKGQGTV